MVEDLRWSGGRSALRGHDDSGRGIGAAGTFGGSASFGGATLQPNVSSKHGAFFARFTDTGSHLWSKAFVGTGKFTPRSMCTDSKGDVYFAGDLSGSVAFDATTLDSGLVVGKLAAATGDVVWARQVSATGSNYARGIACDATGTVFVAHGFSGTINIDGVAYQSQKRDALVYALDSTGSFKWSYLLSGPEDDEPRAIALDSKGRLWLTGDVRGEVDFGKGPVAAMGTRDLFLLQIDAAQGTPVEGRRFAASDYLYGNWWPMKALATTDQAVKLGGVFYTELKIDAQTRIATDEGAFLFSLQP